MNQPIAVWIAVVALVSFILAIKAIAPLKAYLKTNKVKGHIISFANDREMFYCPGDEYLIDDDDEF